MAASTTNDTTTAGAYEAPETELASSNALTKTSPWPRRLAVVLVVLVWPLIWVGGLVTTYDAGMSVPDWPGTYGYNLFLYPLSTWLLGPFDLFIEHGHRLLGALVGFVAIGFLVASWRGDSRKWLTVLAAGVLVAVIGQGVLGGLRVTMSARVLAMVHGCTGPAFFALCVVAACVTGQRWRRKSVLASAGVGQSEEGASASPRMILPVLLMAISYLQIVFGAQLRHALPSTSPGMFAHTAMTHAAIALLFWLLAGIAWWRMRGCGDLTLSRPAAGLICLVAVQILLGVGTWIVNYGYPPILESLPGSGSYRLESKNLLDAWIVTGHVATGSLILAFTTLLTVRLARRRSVLSTWAHERDA
ncbi:COX15/CtaA family protein [Rhodopirellula sp. SWK7]|uniref:COX15/CtaA family protein n=1 Tax=Rhodopirellula sp. SWK7 TaxID=595460 RepID=UPI0002BD7CA3|nr:COX15/CtaA family protein [Rhodopirellula sp. SWK7]EMI44425.1 protein required for cytochrome oxidase assembly-like protein [Rhodopirellula sp. SWK7]